jgi:DNA-binding XRE family transcriptional regulator
MSRPRYAWPVNGDDITYMVWARRVLGTPGEGAALRRRLRLSRADIAAHLGVSPEAIAKWETGERTPNREHAVRYGRLMLGLSLQIGEA